MNWIFSALIVASVLTAALTGHMPEVGAAAIASAKGAVDLALSLVGQMTLWLGLLGVVREAGLIALFGRALKPVMTRLFPEVPVGHPALGSMVMNIAANMLGLGNAATPFGLKAMAELETLNPTPGVATNSMALFLAINTTGIAVLPLTAVTVRASLGSTRPAAIIVPTLLTTFTATLATVAATKVLERIRYFKATPGLTPPRAPAVAPTAVVADETPPERPPVWKRVLTLGVFVVLFGAIARHLMLQPDTLSAFEIMRPLMSEWILPLLLCTVVAIGFGGGVKVYETYVRAAKEGFQTAVGIIPFLVGMLVAIGMFRASGAMTVVVDALGVITQPLGFPPEALPMALIRPLSGSGATAVMSETMKTLGPDSFIGQLVSVINGGTETTFYVLALYFGSVQVRAMRHTLPACLVGDVVSACAAVVFTRMFF